MFLTTIFDKIVKSHRGVIPANAGIQNILKILDRSFRRDGGKSYFRTFYGAICSLQYALFN